MSSAVWLMRLWKWTRGNRFQMLRYNNCGAQGEEITFRNLTAVSYSMGVIALFQSLSSMVSMGIMKGTERKG
jgi:hypothetical protein